MSDTNTSDHERGHVWTTLMDSNDQNLGAETMDIDVTPEMEETFRQNSLALVTYPWSSGIVMESDWFEWFDEEHFAYVSFATHVFISQIE